MITIFTICFNESFMLPHFIEHYRRMFPNCNIILYDNGSTDNTVEIAKKNECEVRNFDTGGKLSDSAYLQIKNNCWKDAKTDWVCVVDCDEHLYLNEQTLLELDKNEVTIIRSEGYNMVNMFDDMDIDGIDTAIRSESYDKKCCFKRTAITEINYNMGCHAASPEGTVVESLISYPLLHYKYLNPDYMVRRHALFASRLSEENIAKTYGAHYLYSEEKIRSDFEDARKQAVKLW